MKKIGLLFLALIIAMGLCGVGYAHGHHNWGHKWGYKDKKIELWDCRIVFESASSNDPGVTIDPGYDKHVASTEASIGGTNNNLWNCCCLPTRNLIITVNNAYPCYQSQVYVTIKNRGTLPAIIQTVTVTSPTEVTVTTDIEALIGVEIDPCESEDGTVSVHVEQSAAQRSTYTFTIEIQATCQVSCFGGTPGYWQNWKAHHTASEVTAWLNSINAASCWLVPDLAPPGGVINTADLDAIRDASVGKGHTMYDLFLMHYLAARLNVESGRLSTGIALNISGYDPMNWLGVSNPTNATLGEVITKIESKCGLTYSKWTKKYFEIMKNVCEAFNQLGES